MPACVQTIYWEPALFIVGGPRCVGTIWLEDGTLKELIEGTFSLRDLLGLLPNFLVIICVRAIESRE